MIERAQNFFDRGERVESVKVVEIDVVGAQAAQAGLTGSKYVIPRRSQFIRSFPHAKRGLGRDENIVTASFYSLAENFLRKTVRIDVGCVKQIHAGLEANGNHTAGFGYIGCTPGAKELSSSAKCGGAKT